MAVYDADGLNVTQQQFDDIVHQRKTLAERCHEYERQLKRMHLDVMCGFVSLEICTPEEGFIKAPQCLLQCFDQIREKFKQHDRECQMQSISAAAETETL